MKSYNHEYWWKSIVIYTIPPPPTPPHFDITFLINIYTKKKFTFLIYVYTISVQYIQILFQLLYSETLIWTCLSYFLLVMNWPLCSSIWLYIVQHQLIHNQQSFCRFTFLHLISSLQSNKPKAIPTNKFDTSPKLSSNTAHGLSTELYLTK